MAGAAEPPAAVAAPPQPPPAAGAFPPQPPPVAGPAAPQPPPVAGAALPQPPPAAGPAAQQQPPAAGPAAPQAVAGTALDQAIAAMRAASQAYRVDRQAADQQLEHATSKLIRVSYSRRGGRDKEEKLRRIFQTYDLCDDHLEECLKARMQS